MLLNLLNIATTLCCSLSDTALNVPVDTVYIQAQRLEFSQLGRVKVDLFQPNSAQNLQNSLSNQAIFVKQYGVSGSSTISRRGADAAQTQVLWNGLPVNNPMLGMTDFNNISTFGLQEAFLIEGGNAALLGSGSVGGTVFLRNKLKFNEGFTASVFQQLSQFQNRISAVNVVYSGKIHYFQTTWSQMNFLNKFNFFDPILNQSRIAENANLFQNTFRTVYGFKFQKHELKAVLEWAKNRRGLGQQIGSELLFGTQHDENIRSVVEYQFNTGKWLFVNRIGFVQDVIKYAEQGAKWDSSAAKTPYFQSEVYKNWMGVRWLFGIDAQQQNAYSINYSRIQVERLYAAAFAAATFKIKKTDFHANARHEFYEQLPTFGLSTITPVLNFFQVKTNVHTTFRRPTLNDLFWKTNATVATKPEKGFGAELGILKNQSFKHFEISAEITGFYRELNLPIIWVPNGWSWIATNFYHGQYTGIQYSVKISRAVKENKWLIASGGEVVNTQVKKTEIGAAFQQIFIPDFMGYLSGSFERKKWGIKLEIQHTGNRYIQTDNQAFLSGYRLVNGTFFWKTTDLLSFKNKKKIKADFSLEIKNIFNTVYQNMPGRPMPGRTVWLNMNILI